MTKKFTKQQINQILNLQERSFYPTIDVFKLTGALFIGNDKTKGEWGEFNILLSDRRVHIALADSNFSPLHLKFELKTCHHLRTETNYIQFLEQNHCHLASKKGKIMENSFAFQEMPFLFLQFLFLTTRYCQG